MIGGPSWYLAPMTHVQEFLKSHSLEDLTKLYAITVKRHPEFSNLVMLKYDQIDSPMGEAIVQECRGIILDEADGWKIISYPFKKFFNSGEGHAANIDWSTATVYEKLDGSLLSLFWYRGHWRVASSGVPDAGGNVYGADFTFAELFWYTFHKCGYSLPGGFGGLWTFHTFMFELMTPHNRVVVPHTECKLVLIGCRHLLTTEELAPETVGPALGWKSVRTFRLRSIDAIIEAATALNPMQSEGFVVRDAGFNRIKVKSPQYVALSHMKEQFSARRMLEVVRANESDEFISYFPEMKPLYEAAKRRFESLVHELETNWERIAGIRNRKEFAESAVKTRCPSALFAMLDGKTTSIRHFLAGAGLQVVERAVGPIEESTK
jgi:hypothetical protein